MNLTFTFDELLALFRKNIDQVNKFRQIPPDNLLLKPAPAAWSVIEIAEHLVRFNTIYLGYIENALDSVPKQPSTSTNFRPRFIFRILTKWMRPPYKIKMKTITPMVPEGRDYAESRDVTRELIELNKRVIHILSSAKAKQLDLNRIKGKNDVFKINMTVIEFLLMLEAHQQRHIWQAEKTLEKITGKNRQA